MSTAAHKHHILPLKVYLAVGGALLMLTAVTVAVATIDLGPFNLVVAMVIAATKALLVALFFMHLWFDNKLYMLIFSIGVLFLAIFIIFTMFDTERRGEINADSREPIVKESVIYNQDKPADTDHTEDHAEETTTGH